MMAQQPQGHFRLEPLQKQHQSRQHHQTDDLEKQAVRLSDSNNKCCRCCGLTRFLRLQRIWFIQIMRVKRTDDGGCPLLKALSVSLIIGNLINNVLAPQVQVRSRPLPQQPQRDASNLDLIRSSFHTWVEWSSGDKALYSTVQWDPCGIICAVLTYMLLVYGITATNAILLYPVGLNLYGICNGILFNLLGFLAFVSHVKAMTTDPGAVPLGNATRDQLGNLGLKVGQVVYRCPKCICIKPERTHHCSVCRRCIRKMDHHCPWVNNCVGEFNQKYFVLFTLYIASMCTHSLIMQLIHFVSCVGTDWGDGCAYFSMPATVVFMMIVMTKTTHDIAEIDGCAYFSMPATVVFMMTIMMEGILFSLFTLIMFCTQIHAIVTDETGIEQLKRQEPTWERKSRCLSMKAVFGSKMNMGWLNPFVKPDIGNGKELAYMYSV